MSHAPLPTLPSALPCILFGLATAILIPEYISVSDPSWGAKDPGGRERGAQSQQDLEMGEGVAREGNA